MKNNGKSLERAIKLIQESLEDSSNSQVIQNAKLLDEGGQTREIDILIISTINGYEIRIALECKDYNKKIPVKEIEAFNSKTDRIKEINKKVFISTQGFQKGAIKAADYYNIDLHTADKLTTEQVYSWFTIKIMSVEVLQDFIAPEFHLDADENQIKTIKNFDGIIYDKYDVPVDTKLVLLKAVRDNYNKVQKLAILRWLELNNNFKVDPQPVKFHLNLEGYYILNSQNNKIQIMGLVSSVYVRFNYSDPKIIEARQLKNNKKKVLGNFISIDMGNNRKSDIVLSDTDKNFYATDENGKTEKLEVLFTYDPKTMKFSLK